MKTLEEFAIKEIEDLRNEIAYMEKRIEEYKYDRKILHQIIDTILRYIKLNNGCISMYIFNDADIAFLKKELDLKEEANNE